MTCQSSADCPDGADCYNQMCQRPLKVGALYQGVVSDGEGFTLTHHEGLMDAADELQYVQLSYVEGVMSSDKIAPAVDQFVAEGAKVIVSTSAAQLSGLAEKVEQYPDVKFLSFGFSGNGANQGSFFAYIEQAFYLAGVIAAQVASQKGEQHLGFIGAYITPQVVRRVNAFTLGARTVNPDITIELRWWIGWWSDPRTAASESLAGTNQLVFLEELRAQQLVDQGAFVVAHTTANGRAVRYIDTLHEHGDTPSVYSIGNDNRFSWRSKAGKNEGGEPLESCLGAVYYDWKPVYTSAFDQIHRSVWTATEVFENLVAEPDSVVGFQPNTDTAIVDEAAVKLLVLDRMAGISGLGPVFKGPYDTTGQRDADGDGQYDATQSVAAGEEPSAEEIGAMCWFVKGVVELVDPDDPEQGYRDAKVPDATNPAPHGTLTPPGREPGEGHDCTQNL